MQKAIQFGIETIIWGPSPPDFIAILEFVQQAGFQGIEVFQHPRQLRQQFGTPGHFRSAVEDKGLAFIGICSGTLEERVQFCEEAGLHPSYLYVDDWDPFIPEAFRRGYTVALHPHVYKLPNLKYAFEELLGREDRLRVVLDTAHLVVGGLDPVQFVDVAFDRLLAVHLNDWAPWFGRSFHRYAQGFTELGTGSVPLLPFLQKLRARGFAGWLIFEQDTKTATAEQSINQSIAWLREHAFPDAPLRPVPTCDRSGLPRYQQPPSFSTAALTLLDSIVKSQETPDLFPEIVVQGVAAWTGARLVSLWAHCPSQHALTLVASHPEQPPLSSLDVDQCHCGRTIHRKRMTYYPNLRQLAGHDSALQSLVDRLGLSSLLSVPVLNRHNPNDVELLLNIYPAQEVPRSVRRGLPVLADYIASVAERILADRCTRATGAVQELFPRHKTKQDFLQSCLAIILKAVEGEAVSVFLENPATNRLELAATTGIIWRAPESAQYYERGQGKTGRVWTENVEYLSIRRDMEPLGGLSEEQVSDKTRSVLFVPVRDYSGKAIGVVRCRNKVAPAAGSGVMSFSQEDATVLQAVCDAMVPRLLLYEADERVYQMLQKLTHELKMPLVGVNSQLDFIEAETGQHRVSFSENWIKEARDSIQLMGALVHNAEVTIRQLDPRYPPEPFSRVYLLRDIIAPVVDQTVGLLKRYSLSRRRISLSGFGSIPMLWVKANGIRQVVFNLLSNAIKYRYKDRHAFRVAVLDAVTAEHFLVHFRDWGPGVDAAEVDMIFELGWRGTLATQYDVSGHGFGLPIARQIMREHGGDLKLTNLSLPTEFTLLFPRRLVRKP